MSGTSLRSALAPVVILPTYNEAGSVSTILEALMAIQPLVDVAVVDDASPDGTAELAAAVAARHPGRIHVLRRPGKAGLGSAYRYGFSWALERDYDTVVQMDADGSHPPDRLPALLAALVTGGADMAVGSRYVPGGATIGWPLRRRVLSKAANGYARVVLGLSLHDVTGAYRAWRVAALSVADPSATTVAGYGFLVEMAVAAERGGLCVLEVPITFTERATGCSKMTAGVAVEAVCSLWRLRRRGLRLAPRSFLVGAPVHASA